MLHGPWYSDFTPGRYIAQYVVQTDQQTLEEMASNDSLGRMDITASGLITEGDSGYMVLLSTDLTMDVFQSVATQTVEVDFELEDSLWDLEWNDSDGRGPRPSLELNLNCEGSGYLHVDKVLVLQLN